MLDIKRIRENPDLIKDAAVNTFLVKLNYWWTI